MSDVQAIGAAATDSVPPDTGGASRHSAGRVDLVLVAVVVLGLAARFWRLGTQSLWYDEWVTTLATSGGAGDLAHHVATREGAGPPYFVLIWGWARVVGDGEAALRSFSAVVGTATVLVAYVIARQLGRPRRVANGAALLVAANPALIWYSQEARPYSLLALAGALSVSAAIRLDQRAGRSDALLWGLAAAAAVAVHYFALFLVAAEAVGLLARRRVPPRTMAIGCAPVALVLVVLVPLVVEQRAHAANQAWITTFSLTGRLEQAGRLVVAGTGPFTRWSWLGLVAVVVVAGLATARRLGTEDRWVLGALGGLVAANVAVPVAAALVGADAVLGRYLLGAVVPLLVAVAVLLLAPRRPWPGALALVVVLAVWLTAGVANMRDPGRQRPDWRAVAEAVAAGDPDTVLVVDAAAAMSSPLLRYLPDAERLGGAETVTVSEIHVLDARRFEGPCDFLVGRACSLMFLGAPLPAEVAAAFHLEERVVLDQFVVERHRAERPVTLAREDLVHPARDASTWVWATDR